MSFAIAPLKSNRPTSAPRSMNVSVRYTRCRLCAGNRKQMTEGSSSRSYFELQRILLMLIIAADIVIDQHIIAAISITGTVCDVMGGLYLAYDLLGGNNGPLRTLTRAVTYGLIFCIGYGIPF